MRGIGEIRRLASIAKPSVGVITNIGLSHIERLGSQGAIADAKSELLSELPQDGVAVLNAEDCYYIVLCDRFAGTKVSFGSCQGADVIGTPYKM
jgi:UDP-N-acetylmuramoyl-tripeptide--D-alanyl-D-alanine ligase